MQDEHIARHCSSSAPVHLSDTADSFSRAILDIPLSHHALLPNFGVSFSIGFDYIKHNMRRIIKASAQCMKCPWLRTISPSKFGE